jgi:apolipoprotein N-acyltransferase
VVPASTAGPQGASRRACLGPFHSGKGGAGLLIVTFAGRSCPTLDREAGIVNQASTQSEERTSCLRTPRLVIPSDRFQPYVAWITALVALLTYLDVLWIRGIPVFIGPPSLWEDGAVLGLLFVLTGASKRSAALVLGAILCWAAYASPELPTYLVYLVPLVWLWHYSGPSRMWIWEALAVGLVMGWLGAPFMRVSLPYYALVAQTCACGLWAIRVVGFAACFQIVRGWPMVVAAVPAALAATACEVLQAVYGFGGSCAALSLPAAPTPLAQWAYYVGPFGVSFLLYLLNCLWLPDIQVSEPWRFLPPAMASILALLAWVGGYHIASRVDVEPLSFTALIVQPDSDLSQGDAHRGQLLPRWRVLDRLTRAALAEAGPVDLIVWPESSLEASVWPGKLTPVRGVSAREYPGEIGQLAGIRLTDFHQYVLPHYLAPCLVGNDAITPEGQFYNSACLIEPNGTVCRHDKLKLTPLMETLPQWLPSNWLKANVLPAVGLDAPFQPGQDFHLLKFKGRDGCQIRLAIAICYEMHFPWLPQFKQKNKADAIIHLTNELWCSEYPSYRQFETWACQYRAIETRNWQLICTTIGNSAIIDPRGVIRSSLRGEAGVIRTTSISEGSSSDTAAVDVCATCIARR